MENNNTQPAENREIPNQHLADRIAGKVDERGTPVDQALSETPEELPTHLGGIEMEADTTTESEEEKA